TGDVSELGRGVVAQILKIETGRIEPPCFLYVLVNSKVFVISNTSATGVRRVFRSNSCLHAPRHREGIDAAPANSLRVGNTGLIIQHQHVASPYFGVERLGERWRNKRHFSDSGDDDCGDFPFADHGLSPRLRSKQGGIACCLYRQRYPRRQPFIIREYRSNGSREQNDFLSSRKRRTNFNHVIIQVEALVSRYSLSAAFDSLPRRRRPAIISNSARPALL